jgi:hypothetical protein
MKQHLFIVSRSCGWLYEELVERFRQDEKVEVVLDRRLGNRRQGGPSFGGAERRRSDRRRRPGVDEELRSRSHMVVSL